jgi:hypothetical protein
LVTTVEFKKSQAPEQGGGVGRHMKYVVAMEQVGGRFGRCRSTKEVDVVIDSSPEQGGGGGGRHQSSEEVVVAAGVTTGRMWWSLPVLNQGGGDCCAASLPWMHAPG